jgi:hypothetical protein
MKNNNMGNSIEIYNIYKDKKVIMLSLYNLIFFYNNKQDQDRKICLHLLLPNPPNPPTFFF